MDAGVAGVRFPEDRVSLGGPWLRASVARDTSGLLLRGSASLIAGPGSAAGSAEAAAWRRLRLGEQLGLDAGLEGSSLFGSAVRASESALAGARVSRALRAGSGIWIGGSAHLARREVGALTGHGVETGAWWRWAVAELTARLTREAAEAQLFADEGRGAAVGRVPVRYVEGSLRAASDQDWGTVALTAGARRDPDAAERIEAVWSANAVVWLASNRAVTFDVARQPADFVRGGEATASVSVGLRFGGRERSGMAAPTDRVTVEAGSGDATHRLRVRAPRARTVELMADFTGWETVSLARDGRDFVLDGAIASGVHRLAIRIDGGRWSVPANIPGIDDDFGGRVGLVVVP